MSGGAFYRSTHPDVVAAWDDTQRRYREWHAATGAFIARYPGRHGRQRRSGSSLWFVGLDGETKPDVGWRFSGGTWVADKRTKAGKALAGEIAALEVTSLGRLPGIPLVIISVEDGMWHDPGIRCIDGVVWVSYGCSAEEVERGKGVDSVLWDRVKASEYYAAIESADSDPERAGPRRRRSSRPPKLTDRRYVAYDIEQSYLDTAQRRLDATSVLPRITEGE